MVKQRLRQHFVLPRTADIEPCRAQIAGVHFHVLKRMIGHVAVCCSYKGVTYEGKYTPHGIDLRCATHASMGTLLSPTCACPVPTTARCLAASSGSWPILMLVCSGAFMGSLV